MKRRNPFILSYSKEWINKNNARENNLSMDVGPNNSVNNQNNNNVTNLNDNKVPESNSNSSTTFGSVLSESMDIDFKEIVKNINKDASYLAPKKRSKIDDYVTDIISRVNFNNKHCQDLKRFCKSLNSINNQPSDMTFFKLKRTRSLPNIFTDKDRSRSAKIIEQLKNEKVIQDVYKSTISLQLNKDMEDTDVYIVSDSDDPLNQKPKKQKSKSLKAGNEDKEKRLPKSKDTKEKTHIDLEELSNKNRKRKSQSSSKDIVSSESPKNNSKYSEAEASGSQFKRKLTLGEYKKKVASELTDFRKVDQYDDLLNLNTITNMVGVVNKQFSGDDLVINVGELSNKKNENPRKPDTVKTDRKRKKDKKKNETPSKKTKDVKKDEKKKKENKNSQKKSETKKESVKVSINLDNNDLIKEIINKETKVVCIDEKTPTKTCEKVDEQNVIEISDEDETCLIYHKPNEATINSVEPFENVTGLKTDKYLLLKTHAKLTTVVNECVNTAVEFRPTLGTTPVTVKQCYQEDIERENLKAESSEDKSQSKTDLEDKSKMDDNECSSSKQNEVVSDNVINYAANIISVDIVSAAVSPDTTTASPILNIGEPNSSLANSASQLEQNVEKIQEKLRNQPSDAPTVDSTKAITPVQNDFFIAEDFDLQEMGVYFEEPVVEGASENRETLEFLNKIQKIRKILAKITQHFQQTVSMFTDLNPDESHKVDRVNHCANTINEGLSKWAILLQRPKRERPLIESFYVSALKKLETHCKDVITGVHCRKYHENLALQQTYMNPSIGTVQNQEDCDGNDDDDDDDDDPEGLHIVEDEEEEKEEEEEQDKNEETDPVQQEVTAPDTTSAPAVVPAIIEDTNIPPTNPDLIGTPESSNNLRCSVIRVIPAAHSSFNNEQLIEGTSARVRPIENFHPAHVHPKTSVLTNPNFDHCPVNLSQLNFDKTRFPRQVHPPQVTTMWHPQVRQDHLNLYAIAQRFEMNVAKPKPNEAILRPAGPPPLVSVNPFVEQIPNTNLIDIIAFYVYYIVEVIQSQKSFTAIFANIRHGSNRRDSDLAEYTEIFQKKMDLLYKQYFSELRTFAGVPRNFVDLLKRVISVCSQKYEMREVTYKRLVVFLHSLHCNKYAFESPNALIQHLGHFLYHTYYKMFNQSIVAFIPTIKQQIFIYNQLSRRTYALIQEEANRRYHLPIPVNYASVPGPVDPIPAPVNANADENSVEEVKNEEPDIIDLTWLDDVEENEPENAQVDERFNVAGPSGMSRELKVETSDAKEEELSINFLGPRACICGQPADQVCGPCKSAIYCSQYCQNIDWENHRNVCLKHQRRMS